MGGKKPQRMMPHVWKKEFENNLGKKLVLIAFVTYYLFYFLYIFIFTLIKKLSPFMFPKGHQGGIPQGMKRYSI